MSFSQFKSRTLTSHAKAHRSAPAQNFIKLLPELLTLLAIAAPVLALVCIGLLHSGLYLFVAGSTVVVSLLVPVALLALSASVALFKNPVHSLIALIGAFLSAFVMYVVLRAQYLAYVFLIVYVGAVAILFLFVVMLLNVKALYSAGPLITSIRQVAEILVCVLLGGHALEVLRAGFYPFTLSLTAGMPKLAPFTLDALVYAVDSASDILGFSALFEARAAALLLVILFILLAAMLGAIVQATKSMEVGTPDVKNLEVYTETATAVKGFNPTALRAVPTLRNSVTGLIIIALLFGCSYARDYYIITDAFSRALPHCRNLADAQEHVSSLGVQINTLFQSLEAKGVAVLPGTPYFDAYHAVVRQYRPS